MLTKPQQLELLPGEAENSGKRVQGGIATSDVVMSAYIEGNADVFPKILALL